MSCDKFRPAWRVWLYYTIMIPTAVVVIPLQTVIWLLLRVPAMMAVEFLQALLCPRHDLEVKLERFIRSVDRHFGV